VDSALLVALTSRVSTGFAFAFGFSSAEIGPLRRASTHTPAVNRFIGHTPLRRDNCLVTLDACHSHASCPQILNENGCRENSCARSRSCSRLSHSGDPPGTVAASCPCARLV